MWHRIVNGVWKWSGMRAWHRKVSRQLRAPGGGDIPIWRGDRHADSIPVMLSPGGKVYGDGLEFDDPGWRHTALCRECDTEGHFATEDSRDAWMREHEKLGLAHREWRTQSFDWE